MLGGFLLLRRAMLDELGGFDAGLPDVRRGHRPLLPRREGGLGALVRAAGGRHATAGTRSPTSASDAAHALALARDRPLRAQAPRAAAGAR